MNAPASNARPAQTRGLTPSIFLWFEMLALAIGVAQLAGAGPPHRIAAIVALCLLLVTTVAVRVMPLFKVHVRVRYLVELLALLILATVLCYATGGVHSPVLTLFLLPLTGGAMVLNRLAYGAVVLAVVLAAVLLGAVTPGISVASANFAIWCIGSLAPAMVATGAIVLLMENVRGAEQHILDLSATDRLTGLLHRRVFDDILQREHRKAERDQRPYCLLIVDVENVGQTNSSLGHDAGNQLIVAVAAAIARSIRATDIAARFGGDEFAVLLVDTDLAVAGTVSQRIRSHVYAGTISVANRMVRANVHIGLAGYPRDKRRAGELLTLAEQRMRHDREVKKPASA
jgi:diguanylate cyclase (GGDEF)-like protein